CTRSAWGGNFRGPFDHW
nr:immunoglobulin heavy chain junction region [Macaca mulatta]MOW98676.1 immunoglobulin heavy chain junction region [Macaca mulatta]MOW98861.1 immunoglobulin heavy chain junction region [Macaca mulatta]MOW99081.1 immunoglobulin heavy chain junction region [Macaca mulatta]MOW99112.1 immunoglobulin heavy chain junction region [Macaca mulatta]